MHYRYNINIIAEKIINNEYKNVNIFQRKDLKKLLTNLLTDSRVHGWLVFEGEQLIAYLIGLYENLSKQQDNNTCILHYKEDKFKFNIYYFYISEMISQIKYKQIYDNLLSELKDYIANKK